MTEKEKMILDKNKNNMWSRAVSIVLLLLFTFDSISWGVPSGLNLSTWTVQDRPDTQRRIFADLYRANRLIWPADKARYQSMLNRFNAQGMLLSTGRYLVDSVLADPEKKDNDLALIRIVTHEDYELLMQKEKQLHEARYMGLMSRILGEKSIMDAYSSLSHYQTGFDAEVLVNADSRGSNADTRRYLRSSALDMRKSALKMSSGTTPISHEFIFNDLISKAFEIYFLLEKNLVYPEKDLTLAERRFIELLRPIIEEKDAEGEHVNFSPIFYDFNERLRVVFELQKDKTERFYRATNTKKEEGPPSLEVATDAQTIGNILRERKKDAKAIKLVVLDLDSTLASQGEELREEMLERIRFLLAHDIKVVINTGTTIEQVEARLINKLNEGSGKNTNLHNLSVVVREGTILFSFDKNGNRVDKYSIRSLPRTLVNLIKDKVFSSEHAIGMSGAIERVSSIFSLHRVKFRLKNFKSIDGEVKALAERIQTELSSNAPTTITLLRRNLASIREALGKRPLLDELQDYIKEPLEAKRGRILELLNNELKILSEIFGSGTEALSGLANAKKTVVEILENEASAIEEVLNLYPHFIDLRMSVITFYGEYPDGKYPSIHISPYDKAFAIRQFLSDAGSEFGPQHMLIIGDDVRPFGNDISMFEGYPEAMRVFVGEEKGSLPSGTIKIDSARGVEATALALDALKKEIRSEEEAASVFTGSWRVALDSTNLDVAEVMEKAGDFLMDLVKKDSFIALINKVSRGYLNLSEFTGDIMVQYNSYTKRRVNLKVTFGLKDGRSVSIFLNYHTLTDHARKIESFNYLKRLNGRFAPIFGREFVYKKALWTVEEFIDGDVIDDVISQGRFTSDLRKRLVSAFLSITKTLDGACPRGIDRRKFIVTRDNRIVLFELTTELRPILGEGRNIEERAYILGRLLSLYTWGSGRSDLNEVFSVFIEELGSEEGTSFLREARDFLKGISDLKIAKNAEFVKAIFRGSKDKIAGNVTESNQKKLEFVIAAIDAFLDSLEDRPSSEDEDKKLDKITILLRKRDDENRAIKAVVLDMDNILTMSGSEASKKMFERLNLLLERGIKVIINTSDTIDILKSRLLKRKRLKNLKNLYIFTEDGTSAYVFDDNDQLSSLRSISEMPNTLYRHIEALMRGLPASVLSLMKIISEARGRTFDVRYLVEKKGHTLEDLIPIAEEITKILTSKAQHLAEFVRERIAHAQRTLAEIQEEQMREKLRKEIAGLEELLSLQEKGLIDLVMRVETHFEGNEKHSIHIGPYDKSFAIRRFLENPPEGIGPENLLIIGHDVRRFGSDNCMFMDFKDSMLEPVNGPRDTGIVLDALVNELRSKDEAFDMLLGGEDIASNFRNPNLELANRQITNNSIGSATIFINLALGGKKKIILEHGFTTGAIISFDFDSGINQWVMVLRPQGPLTGQEKRYRLNPIIVSENKWRLQLDPKEVFIELEEKKVPHKDKKDIEVKRTWQDIEAMIDSEDVKAVYINLNTLIRSKGYIGSELWRKRRNEEKLGIQFSYAEQSHHEERMLEDGNDFLIPMEDLLVDMLKRIKSRGKEIVIITERPSQEELHVRSILERLFSQYIPEIGSSRIIFDIDSQNYKTRLRSSLKKGKILFVDDSAENLSSLISIPELAIGITPIQYIREVDANEENPEHYLALAEEEMEAGSFVHAREYYLSAAALSEYEMPKNRIEIDKVIGRAIKALRDIRDKRIDISDLEVAFMEEVSDLLRVLKEGERNDPDLTELLELYFGLFTPNPATFIKFYRQGLINFKHAPLLQRRLKAELIRTEIDRYNVYAFLEPILSYILEHRPQKILLIDTGARPLKLALDEFLKFLAAKGIIKEGEITIGIIPISAKTLGDTEYALSEALSFGKRCFEEKEAFQDRKDIAPLERAMGQKARDIFPLDGKRVLVIDDNVVEGRTVGVAYRLLKRFGVKEAAVGALAAFNERAQELSNVATCAIPGHFNWVQTPPVTFLPEWEPKDKNFLIGVKKRTTYLDPFPRPLPSEYKKEYEEFKETLVSNFMEHLAANWDHLVSLQGHVKERHKAPRDLSVELEEEIKSLDGEMRGLLGEVCKKAVSLGYSSQDLVDDLFQVPNESSDINLVKGRIRFAAELIEGCIYPSRELLDLLTSSNVSIRDILDKKRKLETDPFMELDLINSPIDAAIFYSTQKMLIGFKTFQDILNRYRGKEIPEASFPQEMLTREIELEIKDSQGNKNKVRLVPSRKLTDLLRGYSSDYDWFGDQLLYKEFLNYQIIVDNKFKGNIYVLEGKDNEESRALIVSFIQPSMSFDGQVPDFIKKVFDKLASEAAERYGYKYLVSSSTPGVLSYRFDVMDAYSDEFGMYPDPPQFQLDLSSTEELIREKHEIERMMLSGEDVEARRRAFISKLEEHFRVFGLEGPETKLYPTTRRLVRRFLDTFGRSKEEFSDYIIRILNYRFYITGVATRATRGQTSRKRGYKLIWKRLSAQEQKEADAKKAWLEGLRPFAFDETEEDRIEIISKYYSFNVELPVWLSNFIERHLKARKKMFDKDAKLEPFQEWFLKRITPAQKEDIRKWFRQDKVQYLALEYFIDKLNRARLQFPGGFFQGENTELNMAKGRILFLYLLSVILKTRDLTVLGKGDIRKNGLGTPFSQVYSNDRFKLAESLFPGEYERDENGLIKAKALTDDEFKNVMTGKKIPQPARYYRKDQWIYIVEDDNVYGPLLKRYRLQDYEYLLAQRGGLQRVKPNDFERQPTSYILNDIGIELKPINLAIEDIAKYITGGPQDINPGKYLPMTAATAENGKRVVKFKYKLETSKGSMEVIKEIEVPNDIEEGARLLLILENDVNHGLVLNMYEYERYKSYAIKKRTHLLAPDISYIYRDGEIYAINLDMQDIVEYINGRSGLSRERPVKLELEAQWDSSIKLEGINHAIDVPIRYGGESVLLVLKRDVNHGLVLNIYDKSSHESDRLSKPIKTYITREGQLHDVDLGSMDIASYLGGERELYLDPARSVKVEVDEKKDVISIKSLDTVKEIQVPPGYRGKAVELMLQNDPDYGAVLNIYPEGSGEAPDRIIVTYIGEEPVNIYKKTLIDYIFRRSRIVDDRIKYITPRIIEPGMRDQLVFKTRGSKVLIDERSGIVLEVPRLSNGEVIIVIEKNMKFGYLFRIYEKERYLRDRASGKASTPVATFVRSETEKELVPLEDRYRPTPDELASFRNFLINEINIYNVIEDLNRDPKLIMQFILQRCPDRFRPRILRILLDDILGGYDEPLPPHTPIPGGGGNGANGHEPRLRQVPHDSNRLPFQGVMHGDGVNMESEKEFAKEIIIKKLYRKFAEDEIETLRILDEASRDPHTGEAYRMAYSELKREFEEARDLNLPNLNDEVVEKQRDGSQTVKKMFIYQKMAVAKMLSEGLGNPLLADDTGLGKTIETIGVALHVRKTGRIGARNAFLIVPGMVKDKWRKEIARWTKAEHEIVVIKGLQGEVDIFIGGRELTEEEKTAHYLTQEEAARREGKRKVRFMDVVKGRPIDPSCTRFIISSYDSIRVTYEVLFQFLKENGFISEEDKETFADNYYDASKKSENVYEELVSMIRLSLAWQALDGEGQTRIEKLLRSKVESSYGVLRAIEELRPDFIAVDEAHGMRNLDSKQTQSLSALHWDENSTRLLISATPLYGRKLTQLFPLLRWLRPGQFYDEDEFKRKYGLIHEKGQTSEVRQDKETEGRLRLYSDIKPFMIRRLKNDVGIDLPPMSFRLEHVALTSQERAIYNHWESDYRSALIAESKEAGMNILFPKLQKLRQAASFPNMIGTTNEELRFTGVPSKVLRVQELLVEKLETVTLEDVKTGEIFTLRGQDAEVNLRGVIYKKRYEKDIGVILADNEGREIPICLRDNETNIKISGAEYKIRFDKVVIFVEWVDLLYYLRDYFKDRYGINIIHGDQHGRIVDRQKEIDEFQDINSNTRLLISTYGVGSEGLDLFAANTVILYHKIWDRPKQPIDRVHRIGQGKPVEVISIIAENTIDWDIEQTHTRKDTVIGQTIEGDVSVQEDEERRAMIIAKRHFSQLQEDAELVGLFKNAPENKIYSSLIKASPNLVSFIEKGDVINVSEKESSGRRTVVMEIKDTKKTEKALLLFEKENNREVLVSVSFRILQRGDDEYFMELTPDGEAGADERLEKAYSILKDKLTRFNSHKGAITKAVHSGLTRKGAAAIKEELSHNPIARYLLLFINRRFPGLSFTGLNVLSGSGLAQAGYSKEYAAVVTDFFEETSFSSYAHEAVHHYYESLLVLERIAKEKVSRGEEPTSEESLASEHLDYIRKHFESGHDELVAWIKTHPEYKDAAKRNPETTIVEALAYTVQPIVLLASGIRGAGENDLMTHVPSFSDIDLLVNKLHILPESMLPESSRLLRKYAQATRIDDEPYYFDLVEILADKGEDLFAAGLAEGLLLRSDLFLKDDVDIRELFNRMPEMQEIFYIAAQNIVDKIKSNELRVDSIGVIKALAGALHIFSYTMNRDYFRKAQEILEKVLSAKDTSLRALVQEEPTSAAVLREALSRHFKGDLLNSFFSPGAERSDSTGIRDIDSAVSVEMVPPRVPGETITRAFKALTRAVERSELNTFVSRLRGSSQRPLAVSRLHFLVPVDVLKNSADLISILKDIGKTRNGAISFELVVTGVTEEDIAIIYNLKHNEEIRKVLEVPENLNIRIITEDDIRSRAELLGEKGASPQIRTRIIKDLYLEILGEQGLASSEYMLVATDAVTLESAQTLREELSQDLEENISIRILVGPDSKEKIFSLSLIINDWRESVQRGRKSTISVLLPPIITSYEIMQRLDEAVRTAWHVLSAA